jgi:mono/diheme cytochrome c family protein
MAKGSHSGVGLYVVIALILAVITYIEYYIVEFPLAWLGPGWTLFWLVTLSVAKFIMVIWFFMHLRDDDKLYTGFFASGFVIAMGTFAALMAMFLLPRAVAPVMAATQPPAIGQAHGEGYDPYAAKLDEETRARIETDGLSRPLAERSDSPRPSDRTLRITPPAAAADTFELRTDEVADPDDAAAPAEPEAAAEPDDVAEPAAAEPTPPADEPIVAEASDPTFDRALGASVYAANCAGCHQANGAGIVGVFPPLADHSDDLYRADGGTYLINVLLYGLQGPIVVAGTTYSGFMPAWAHLSDEQIAAVINHTIAGFDGAAPPDDFDAIRPADVAAERNKGLAPAAVHELRSRLRLE